MFFPPIPIKESGISWRCCNGGTIRSEERVIYDARKSRFCVLHHTSAKISKADIMATLNALNEAIFKVYAVRLEDLTPSFPDNELPSIEMIRKTESAAKERSRDYVET